MDKSKEISNVGIIGIGLAIFSMFFGAGNVVFPLALGQYAQNQNSYAILGMLITGVTVPFLGLVAMSLFDGNYRAFFGRLGKIPGFTLMALMLGLIGPFGAIPRCITLSYSTIQDYIPWITPWIFNLFACGLILIFCWKKSRVIDLLGYVLTPLLLISLGLIIVVGLLAAPEMPLSHISSNHAFLQGMYQGNQLMDLLGAFFFSSVVLNLLEQNAAQKNHKTLIFKTLKAGLLGTSLLGLAYIGFSYVAAFHSQSLQGVPSQELIATLSTHVLGAYGGLVACLAVAFACLTTAIALTVVFAEFLDEDLSQKKIGYFPSLLITLGITLLISTLNFNGIVAFLAPILTILYPGLIVLTLVNIAFKLKHFQPVKTLVFITFALSLIGYLSLHSS